MGLEPYKNAAMAYVLGLDPGKRGRSVFKIWSNLRGDACRAVENLKVDDFNGEAGYNLHMAAFKRRFPDSQLW
eukprot:3249989-Lingulodinium_polyedra.AAC.1